MTKPYSLSVPSFQLSPALALAMIPLCCLVFGPGQSTNDTLSILREAATGLYSNHHAPINALFYKLCQSILAGTGLILFIHMCLLWASVARLMSCCTSKWQRLYLISAALYPPLLIYGVHIWKDVTFTFTYLFVSSLLIDALLKPRQPMSALKFLALASLTILATACKYQAIYAMPWLVYLLLGLKFKLNAKLKLLACLLITFASYQSIEVFNHTMSRQQGDAQSWQGLRLYDLSGISTKIGEDLLPAASKTKFYSFAALTDTYENQMLYFRNRLVDYFLIENTPTGLLQKVTTRAEQARLESAWLQAIINHPGPYLRHRAAIWWEAISTPYFKSAPERWLGAHHYPLWPAYPLRALSYLPILILSLVLVYRAFWQPNTPYRQVVLYLNGMSLTLITILFFCSLAGPPRYTFFSLVITLFSVPFIFDPVKKATSTHS